MVDLAASVFRDFVTDGVPSSGTNKPRKHDVRQWGAYLESLATLAFTNGKVYATKAALDADLVPAANTPALVIGDGVNDGLYMKVGATTTGSWTRLVDFVPGAQIVHAVDVGAGTPDAIIATSTIGVSTTSGSQLIRLDVFETNTGSPATVSFNGGTLLTIKTASGINVAAGGLTPGPVLGFISGTSFRLLSDQASAAIVAAAEAAQAAAEDWRDEAEAFALAAQSVSTELAHPVTRAALKALNTATHTAAIVVEPGFERIARWNSAADAYMNTADPNELVFAQPTPASAGAWMMSPIPKKQIGIFEQVKYRMTVGKVDFVGIGDSNQILSGFGWDHGFQYALTALGFPMWATGLISQNENNGSGSGQGYLYNRSGSLVGAVSGAHADLDKYLNKGLGGLFPAYYTYIADGGSFGSTLANGLVVTGTCPLDTSAALQFDGYYGTFPSGAGSFRPFSRWEEAPFTTLSDPGAISTNTGAYGIQKVTLTAAADPTRAGKQVGMRWTRPSVAGITGPFFCTYMRARNTDRTTGYAYGTLEYRGGQSARTMAYDLQQASNDTLTHYFSILRADQGSGAKTIAICINSGLNDRLENLTSVGTAAIADGDSASAFVDNVRAIVDRIKAVWTLNGWDQRELFWLFQVSHPQSSPDDAELVAYRAALEAYALYVDQAQVIDLSVVVSYADLIANGWYLNPVSDHAHLTQAGYEGGSLAILRATL